MTAEMMKHIELVVQVLGEERLTVNEIVTGLDLDMGRGSIQRWLSLAMESGILNREKTVTARRREYVYFVSNGKSSNLDADHRKAFVIHVDCPGCGHVKRIEFKGNMVDLDNLYQKRTWSCGDCGDLVRMSDRMMWRDLLKNWTDWDCSKSTDMDKRHLDRRPPSVRVGSH